jgi:hypothetical protein
MTPPGPCGASTPAGIAGDPAQGVHVHEAHAARLGTGRVHNPALP